MKTKIYTFAILLFSSIASFGQAPAWLWAKSTGGTNGDRAYSIAMDASGNTYVAGIFDSPTITFGSYTLINEGSYDIFLTKYDANGNILWAKSAGNTGGDYAYSLAIDASGNIYMTGIFDSPTLNFGSTTLTNAGSSDIFLAKYAPNGNVLWAKSTGGTNVDMAYSVAVDVSGNTFLAGLFSSSTLSFGSTTLTNAGGSDIFIAKYDSNGNALWAKSAGGTNSDYANAIAVDELGNISLVGYFYSSSITFSSITLTNVDNTSSTTDLFLTKYDTNGNVLWAKSAGGMGDDLAKSITVDASGNSYLAGNFGSPAITFGSTTLTNSGLFLAKYDLNGNVLWAKSADGTVSGSAYSVAVDASGNSYLAGNFGNPTITFGSTTLTNSGLFLAKYDLNGNVLWAKSADGTNSGTAYSVAVDASGNIYMAGWFGGTTIIFGSTTLINTGGLDMFIAKCFGCYTPAIAGTISGTTTVCQGQNSITYTVPTITNATSYTWTLPTGATGASTTNSITVNFGGSSVSGNISVNGHNSCGDGTANSLYITVVPKPNANAGNDTTICPQSSITL